MEQDHRTYTEEEKQAITERLQAITNDLHSGIYLEHAIDASLLKTFHERPHSTPRGSQ